MKVSRAHHLLLLFCLVLSIASVDAGEVRRGNGIIDGSFIVVLHDDTRDDIHCVADELVARHGGSVGRIWVNAITGFGLKASGEQARAIAQDPRRAVIFY